jgi:hypothetical protein
MLPFKVIVSFYSSDNQEIPNLYFIWNLALFRVDKVIIHNQSFEDSFGNLEENFPWILGYTRSH